MQFLLIIINLSAEIPHNTFFKFCLDTFPWHILRANLKGVDFPVCFPFKPIGLKFQSTAGVREGCLAQ